MAYIKTLKDNELVGGTDETDVYPITHTKAIFDSNNKELDQRLKENDDDMELLHRQSEKLILSLTSNKSGDIEINGSQGEAVFEAQAFTETFGDESTVVLDPSQYNHSFTNAEQKYYDTKKVYASAALPSEVGSFTTTFTVEYNGVTKTASVTANMNLRKYFGFSEELTDITVLGTSHFSNSVACTVTIPANPSGDKYKAIYFAVPVDMAISDIKQPDALNAPLAFKFVNETYRIIDGVSYTYKIYKSTDLIDSTISKRLTIS